MKIIVALSCVLTIAQTQIYTPLLINNGLSTEAYQGKLPYQTYILAFSLQGPKSCSGALISDRHVLTSAFCGIGAWSFQVYLGVFDLNSISERGRQIFFISANKAIIHESFNSITGENNIAILNLPVQIKASMAIKPVVLPVSNGESYEGEKAVASGWGHMSDSGGKPRFLKYAESYISENAKCGFSRALNSEGICIPNFCKRERCNGDIGGPLVVIRNGEPILVGVASHVYESRKVSAVYTRVSHFLDWIENKSGV